MRSFLISDSRDTLTGMRLADIKGVFVSSKEQVLEQLYKIPAQEEVRVILITRGVLDMARQEIMKLKLERGFPLIVEIPRPEDAGMDDYISEYIKEAIGLKI